MLYLSISFESATAAYLAMKQNQNRAIWKFHCAFSTSGSFPHVLVFTNSKDSYYLLDWADIKSLANWENPNNFKWILRNEFFKG